MAYVDEQPAPAGGHPPPQGPTPARGSTTIVVIVVVLVVIVMIVGVLASLAIYGFSSYMRKSKSAEGRFTASALARDIASCGEPLPASTTPVPPAAPAGTKYMSTTADWDQPAFACARFSLQTPQYFSYQWLQQSATEGKVVALADLDGDGTPECRVEVAVLCPAGPCTTSPPAVDCGN